MRWAPARKASRSLKRFGSRVFNPAISARAKAIHSSSLRSGSRPRATLKVKRVVTKSSQPSWRMSMRSPGCGLALSRELCLSRLSRVWRR
jgi:hypothetical protein